MYAIDVPVDGSHEGSRAREGTLGHHEGWQHADQELDVQPATPTRTATESATTTDAAMTDDANTDAPAATPTDGDTTATGAREAVDATARSTERGAATTAADGPGFGVPAAVATLGGIAGLLSRYRAPEDDE